MKDHESASEYYGFDPETAPLPYFPDLVEGLREDQVIERAPDSKTVEEQQWIAGFAPPIRTLCAGFGYAPIIADLTVFQDERRLVDPGRPYLVNCVICYRDRADAFNPIMNAYVNALDEMTERPIVPQDAFYKVLYLHRQLSFGRRRAKAASWGQSAFRRKTHYDASASYAPLTVEQLPEALKRLGSTFVKNVGANLGLTKATLLAVPFHRATYRPVIVRVPQEDQQRNGAHRHPSPGGGLFLLLDRVESAQDEQKRIAKLAAALRYMLTLATLTESATNLELQDRAVGMLGNMIHGTVTSISAVSSTNLWSALSDDDRELSTLRYELVKDGVRDRGAEEMLLDAARLVRLGEETAAAMLALAEISVHHGIVPLKHTSAMAHEAPTLVREACGMVNGLAHQDSTGRVAEISADLTNLPRHGFPAGYLDHRVIRGLILEILKNAALHAKRSDGVSAVHVDVGASYTPEDGGSVAISIGSPVASMEWTYENNIAVPTEGSRRASFLIRLAEFCTSCRPGVAVASRVVTEGSAGARYVTTLTFSRVTVRHKNGTLFEVYPVPA